MERQKAEVRLGKTDREGERREGGETNGGKVKEGQIRGREEGKVKRQTEVR